MYSAEAIRYLQWRYNICSRLEVSPSKRSLTIYVSM